MPRKAKDEKNELNINVEKETKLKKKASTSNKKNVDISSKEKKSTSSKSTSKRTTKTTSKIKKSTKNISKTEGVSNSKSKKQPSSRSVSAIAEYYDLPFRYNQTIVKILAQTPNTLFIYWDISDEDRKSYIEKYGEDFFSNTRPYLIITNETMNYTFEVEINDFANSWYLHVNDANCKYKIELCRKFIFNSDNSDSKLDSSLNYIPYHINDHLSITSSNEIDSPNDHILFDKLGSSVFFRNVKTNIVEEKDISSISFLQNIGKVYNIYDLYQKMYQDELKFDEFGVNLPSSSSSSSFK